MKNSILIFLLGIFVTISIAATIPNTGLLTIKPATPKSIFSIGCRSEAAKQYIIKYTKLGYIVKSYTPGAYYDYDCLLIMEKY